MDLQIISQTIKRATKIWNSAARNKTIHVRHNKSDVIFLQGSSSPFWWQATLIIGLKGGVRGEFVTMDPTQRFLSDQLTYEVASAGKSIGPRQIPKGPRKIHEKIKAAKSSLNQLLINSKDEAAFAHQIAQQRERMIRISGNSSVWTLRG